MHITIPHTYLYWSAVVLFVLAALPFNLKVKCEWLAAACLTLTLVT